MKLIDNKIKDISYGINNLELIKENKKEKRIIKKSKKRKGKRKLNNKNNVNLDLIGNTNILNNNDKKEKKNNPPMKKKKIKKLNNNIIDNSANIKRNDNSNRNILNEIKNEEIIKKVKEIMEYNDEELNELEYEIALKNDHRTYCQYYLSLLRIKHIIIFTFYNKTDYNSRIIKINLFFINITIYFVVNALFFNDEIMHKIYEDQGDYNFIYQLPQIIYSSIISAILNVLLKILALSESDIIKFKKIKEKENLNNKIIELKNKLNIKFILYFIMSFIFLLCFWYYLSMFCAIYKNTQLHLIKDTLISFSLSLFYLFGIYLLPGLFRIPALSNPKNERNYLYKLNQIAQMI